MQALRISRLSIILALTLLFQWLFWAEKAGLNALLFALLLSGSLLLLYPAVGSAKRVWLAVLGHFLSALLLLIHNSGTAMVVYLGSTILMVGLIQWPDLRSVPHALGQSIYSYWSLGGSFRREGRRLLVEVDWLQRLWPYLRLIGLPLLGMGVFLAIFLIANPQLGMMMDQLMGQIGNWLFQLSLPHIGFTLLGALLVSGMVYGQRHAPWLEGMAFRPDPLRRERRQVKRPFPLLGLRKEYRSGVLMLALINGTLLINNLVDIRYLWLEQPTAVGVDLRHMVHAGTYLLIVSILLSMLIMLYYFRGNQNFYRQRSLLRSLSYLWIGQNAILVASVALRNYHYIAHFGLAYKRIGVFFFLLLVLFGLLSLFWKIRDRLSLAYLFRVNGWAVYALVLALACINWDMLIARYNLRHAQETGYLDHDFLLSLSPKTLPILLEHQHVFEATRPEQAASTLARLSGKVHAFNQAQASYSWRSWNLADARVHAYLHQGP